MSEDAIRGASEGVSAEVWSAPLGRRGGEVIVAYVEG